MADKNLFSQPPMTTVKEMVFRRLGLNLNDAFVSYSYDVVSGNVTITALARAADGSRPLYIGSVTYPLAKLNLTIQMPRLMPYNGEYPPTVTDFATFLQNTFGYYMEDGEFYCVGDTAKTPLVRGGSLVDTLDPDSQQFSVAATSTSMRWIADTSWAFQWVSPLSLPGPSTS